MRNASNLFVIAHNDSCRFRFTESYEIICKIKFFCFPLHGDGGLALLSQQTRIARKSMRVDFTGKKDVYGRYLRRTNLANSPTTIRNARERPR